MQDSETAMVAKHHRPEHCILHLQFVDDARIKELWRPALITPRAGIIALDACEICKSRCESRRLAKAFRHGHIATLNQLHR